MAGAPGMLTGRDSFTPDIIRASGGAILVKSGAEGVYVAMAPGSGYGIAIKIRDGNARAARVATAAVLQRLGLLEPGVLAGLAAHVRPPILNTRRELVGEIRTFGALTAQ